MEIDKTEVIPTLNHIMELELAGVVRHPHYALIVAALDHLMRHAITGCAHAGHQASRLLDVLSERPEVDSDTRRLCGRMCVKLEAGCGGWHV